MVQRAIEHKVELILNMDVTAATESFFFWVPAVRLQVQDGHTLTLQCKKKKSLRALSAHRK